MVGILDMKSKTAEPKKIIYIDHIGDCFFVRLNTSKDSHLENKFDNYEEAAVFAQGWADGITVTDEIECEVELNIARSDSATTNSPNSILEAEKLQYLVETIGTFADVLIKFTEAAKTFAKVVNATDIKRVYLGSTYSYNILTRFKFLVKSPKLVLWFTRVIMWAFLRLPEKLILRWPLPELRD